MRQRVQYFLSMVTLVALSGCGETATEPIEPTAALDEVAAQAVAADVVEATDARLPHLPSLVHEAIEVVRSDDTQVEAATAFRRASRARRAAREAHKAGDEAKSLRLLRRARRFALEGVIAALGPGVAAEAIAGVEAAIARFRGMRILRQDPWECLVSFICSSASNIPRISGNVEDLCSSFGQSLSMGDHVRSTFPSPRELAQAGEKRLRQLGLGFRAKYLAATATAIANGVPDLMTLREASYEEALEAVIALDGVGDKVANCVLLFSLDKLEAFPVDVWVNRALQEWYFDGRRPLSPNNRRKRKGGEISPKTARLWAQEHFGPYAGYANQYLFHDRRLRGRG